MPFAPWYVQMLPVVWQLRIRPQFSSSHSISFCHLSHLSLSLSWSIVVPLQGSLEYGTVGWTKGQVIGGRWKPLHYMMRRSLYANVVATCGKDATHGNSKSAPPVCYVVNDGIDAFTGNVTIRAVPLASAAATATVFSMPVQLTAGPGVRSWFSIGAAAWELGELGTHVYACKVTSAAGEVVSNHVILPQPPQGLKLQPAKVTFSVGDTVGPDGTVLITVTPGVNPALYVTFTTLAQGRFSDNAFLLEPGAAKTIGFHPFEGFDLQELKTSLRVEHLAENL